jgi:hypothetical protein
MIKNLNIVNVGSHWSNSDQIKFVVKNLIERNEEIWVQYIRINDNTSYECLVDAFTYRFHRDINEQ